MEVIKKDLKDIEQMVLENSKKIDNNVDRIIKNMEKLHSHEERIQENSYALEILRDYKKVNKVFLIFAIVGWLFAILCLVLNFIK